MLVQTQLPSVRSAASTGDNLASDSSSSSREINTSVKGQLCHILFYFFNFELPKNFDGTVGEPTTSTVNLSFHPFIPQRPRSLSWLSDFTSCDLGSVEMNYKVFMVRKIKATTTKNKVFGPFLHKTDMVADLCKFATNSRLPW